MVRICTLAVGAFILLVPAAQAASTDPLQDVHTVGIVSALGKEIHVDTLGVSIFRNAQGTLPLDWDIDGLVTARIAAAVKDRFAVVPVAVDTGKLRAIQQGNLSSGAGFQDYMASLASTNPVDAYIMVLPQGRDGDVMQRRAWFFGLGFMRVEGLFFSDLPVVASASYSVIVIDAKTAKRITGRVANLAEGVFGALPVQKNCDSSLGAKTPADVTDSQKPVMRDELTYLALASLSHTLGRMGLHADADTSADAALEPAVCKKFD
jgi:hypothetical protein